jgi:hypothetical protein
MSYHFYARHVTVSRIARDIGAYRNALLNLVKIHGIELIVVNKVCFVRKSDAERLTNAWKVYRRRPKMATVSSSLCRPGPESPRPVAPDRGGGPEKTTAPTDHVLIPD